MSSVKKNFFYSSILTTANYVFPLITYPYVSRVLEVSNIGAVNFVDSIINYFVLFSMMGVSITGIREIAACNGDRSKMSVVFSSLLVLNFITTCLMLLCLFLSTAFISDLKPHKSLLYIGSLKLIFNLFLIEWFYKGIEDFKYITKRSILVRLIYVATIFIFVRNINDRNIYYFLTISTIIINACINIVYSRKFVRFSLYKLEIKKQVKSFFRLGIYALLTSAYTSFNIMYLGFIAGDTQVGYYTTSTKLFQIIIALFTAFTGVMMPRMSALLAERKTEEFKIKTLKSVNLLFSIMIPAVIFSILLTPQIILIISGPGYQGAIIPMRIVMPLLLIIGYEQILILQMMMPLKLDKEILINSSCTAFLGIALNLLLVRYLESIGSAIVWCVCEIFLLCLSQYVINKNFHFYFPWKTLINNIVYYAPLAVVLGFIINVKLGYVGVFVISALITSIYFIFIELFVIKDEMMIRGMNIIKLKLKIN